MQNTKRVEGEVIAEKLHQRLDPAWKGSPQYTGYRQSLTDMEELRSNTFNRPVESGIPALGKLVVVFKKVVRRCIAWYTNPFAQQQTDFNNAAAATSAYQNQAIEQLRGENCQLRKRLEKAEALLIEIQNRQETVE